MFSRLLWDSVSIMMRLKVKEFKEMIPCRCKCIKIKCGHHNHKRWITLVLHTLRIYIMSIKERSAKVTNVGIAVLR